MAVSESVLRTKTRSADTSCARVAGAAIPTSHVLCALTAAWCTLAAHKGLPRQPFTPIRAGPSVSPCVHRYTAQKADSTLRSSRAVPHPSTNRALCRLTSEVERDPVHSTRYGRQRQCRRVSGVELLRTRPGPTEPDIGLRCRSSPTCTLSQNGYGA